MFRALANGAGAVKRFAGSKPVIDFIRPALAGEGGKITAQSVAGRFAPDAMFGVLAATQTPGDAFDKATAFATSTLGGGLGGAGVTALTRGKLGFLGEMAGGMGGDMLGMHVGDAISRGKDKLMGGEGLTPYERMGAEQQQQFAKDLEGQILAQYGLVPGTREQYAQANPNLMVRYADDTTGQGVS